MAEISESIAGLSGKELEQLAEIIAGMLKIEQVKDRVLSSEGAARSGAEWLERQKINKSQTNDKQGAQFYTGFILSSIRRSSENKIETFRNNIKVYSQRLAEKDVKIKIRKNKLKIYEQKSQKLLEKIERLKVSSNFLNSIDGTGAAAMVSLNARRIAKAESKLEAIAENAEWQKAKIDKLNEKIKTIKQKINKQDEKINKYQHKIDEIAAIGKLGLPNAAISYFLADRAGVSIAELDKAIESPEILDKKAAVEEQPDVTAEESKLPDKADISTDEQPEETEEAQSADELAEEHTHTEQSTETVNNNQIEDMEISEQPLSGYMDNEMFEFEDDFDKEAAKQASAKQQSDSKAYLAVTPQQASALKRAGFEFEAHATGNNAVTLKLNAADKPAVIEAIDSIATLKNQNQKISR